MQQKILDACCGSRMFWFDKNHPDVTYMDNRELTDTLCDGRKLVVAPDNAEEVRDMMGCLFPNDYSIHGR